MHDTEVSVLNSFWEIAQCIVIVACSGYSVMDIRSEVNDSVMVVVIHYYCKFKWVQMT